MNSKYDQPSTTKVGCTVTRPSPACGRGVGERVNQLERAKFLRANQTEAEQRLWYHLRAHRFMGLKFKRQKPIGPFIADFVCMEYGLVIEVDGGQHGGESDRQRDAWFRERGFTVLRFWNNEVLGETEAVLERIRGEILTLSPNPSPACGRGENDGKATTANGRRKNDGKARAANGRGENDRGTVIAGGGGNQGGESMV